MSLFVPCSHDNFAIIGQASSRFALKLKQRLHRLWKKTNSRTGQTRSVLFDILLCSCRHYCHNLQFTAHFV